MPLIKVVNNRNAYIFVKFTDKINSIPISKKYQKFCSRVGGLYVDWKGR